MITFLTAGIIALVLAEMDPDEGEGLVFQVVHERPLLRPLGHSGASQAIPEIEQDHVAAVIAQLEALGSWSSPDLRRLRDGQWRI
jgi:hypothetical protein